MELIISILMMLGFVQKENESFEFEKFKTLDTYQKFYEKAGVELDENPELWAEIVENNK